MKNGSITVSLGLNTPEMAMADTQAVIGTVSTNPNGFLRLLETRLGVNSPEISFTTRLVDYLYAIERTKNPDAFYRASYSKDPFAVARRLLEWRDDLYLAGWTGIFSNQDSLTKRLRDMGTIEAIARGQVAPCIGERWQYILSRLAEDNVYISRINLFDKVEHFSPLVQKVISAIGAEVLIKYENTATATGETDLSRVQAVLSGDMTNVNADNDGSIMLVETEDTQASHVLSAQVLSHVLSTDQQASLALVCEAGGPVMNEELEYIGLPRAGFSENSSWRPVFQVLPLAMELLWNPISPAKLLQFLTNPVCPLAGKLRYPLGRLMAETPGLGSDQWTSRVEEILASEEDSKKRKKYEVELKFWIENERHDPISGAGVPVIRLRIGAVSDWLGTMAAMHNKTHEQSLFQIAKGQADDLLAAVNRLEGYNRGRLSRDNIRRLIDDIKGVGAPVADRQAELAPKMPPFASYRHAGSVSLTASTIVWNGLTGDQNIHLPVWTDSELVALSETGITFLDEDCLLESLSDQRLRPALRAETRLVLIAPKDRSSDHPVWARIRSCAPALKILSAPDIREMLNLKSQETTHLELPGKQREWQLPADVIPQPEKSSYSSLDKYLFKPHQWILSYAAKLQSGSFLLANDGNRLKGNLAHRLIEIFLNEHPDVQTVDLENIAQWTDDALAVLIHKEGAVLLEEGAFKDRIAFFATMKIALKSLISILQDAKIITTQTELWQTAEFAGGPLQGSIDILATNDAGEEAIIDVKYSGLKYRREELKSSNYLQLLTYDRLRQSDPHLSFFIIADGQMLNLAHSFFGQAERVDPDLGLSPSDFWKQIETLWHFRRAQYEAGLVEVPVEGTEPNERSIPDGFLLEIPATNDAFSDYTALTGWETNK